MIYLFLAEGFEETEALTTLDLLRRADIEIKTVGINSDNIVGSHGICIKSDLQLSDINKKECTGVILPGGMPGTTNLLANETVKEFTLYSYNQGSPVCAICAAPLILGSLGILEGKKAVCYPGFENKLTGAEITNVKAVTSDNVITAKAAGAVCEFAYEIIKYVKDDYTASNVLNNIYY